jgi:Septum formation
MSSKVTGDAQSDAGTGAEADHTLPTEIVENPAGAGAGAVTVADGTEPTADSATAESEQAPAAASGPDEPTVVLDAADADNGAEPGELSSAGEDSAGEENSAEDGAWDEDEDPENRAELSEPAEPTELISMSGPVELAEPVEMRRPPRRHWQTVLIAFGFLVAAVAIVGGAIAIVGSLTHGFKKPVIIHYKKSAIFSLKTGECINPNGQTATVVSCAVPHDAEVFATFELPGSKWPGTAAVGTAASSGCSTRLNGYLNPQLAVSLKSTYIYPDSVAWQAGTRTVICEVRATNGQLTGSVRGATATAS